MYYYIVDPQKISQKNFERVQNVLYSSLSEYKISGEVVRVTGLRTIQQLVENAFSHEAKTIVAVGNDQTLHEVINAVGKREMVLGYIPLASSEIGEILGIKEVPLAAKIIAFRRVEVLDLGSVNNNYFLSKLKLGDWDTDKFLPNLEKTFEIKLRVDDQYQADLKVSAVLVVNSRNSANEERVAYPNDGKLDILLLPQLTKWETLTNRKNILSGHFEKIAQCSVIHAKKIEILSPSGINLRADNWLLAKTPAVIEVLPQSLKIIVGRERKF
ncbi:MAG: hypothetical protein KW802_03120 [Candidatus Doudnabacteria bacterium]|nr:hypothetical protein [Candidatus Doudnabacteria bacterium]